MAEASLSTEEGIVNLALSRIGHKAITTLATDSDVEAVAARKVYPNARDRLIRAHTWNALTKRAQLTDSGSDPTFGWDEGYTLPSDFMRIVSVHATNDEHDQPPYKLEKQVLGTASSASDVVLINSSTCYLRYVYKETDPNLWPKDFQNAVAWAVAYDLALELPTDRGLFERAEKMAEKMLTYAKSVDGQEDYPDAFPVGSWVSSRDDESWDLEFTS